MEGIDPREEMKWLDKRISEIQKGLLQAKNVALPLARNTITDLEEAIKDDEKVLEELRARRIRIAAFLEEEMRRVEDDGAKSSAKSDSKSKSN
jgi:hypothetical protein